MKKRKTTDEKDQIKKMKDREGKEEKEQRKEDREDKGEKEERKEERQKENVEEKEARKKRREDRKREKVRKRIPYITGLCTTRLSKLLGSFLSQGISIFGLLMNYLIITPDMLLSM